MVLLGGVLAQYGAIDVSLVHSPGCSPKNRRPPRRP